MNVTSLSALIQLVQLSLLHLILLLKGKLGRYRILLSRRLRVHMSACRMHAVDTAVSYACPFLVRRNHGILEHHDTLHVRNEEPGWCPPSSLRVEEDFGFDVVVHLKTIENSFAMSAASVAAALRWIVPVCSVWLT